MFLLTNATEFRMLDLTGWSLNDVSSYCQMIGLKFDYTGYGYVKNQSIPKDTVIDLNTMTLTIEFDK